MIKHALKSVASVFHIRDAIFFACYFLFVLYAIDPALTYLQQRPIFSLMPDFFREHLAYPGGPVEYAWLFLGQMSAWGWPGAVVITVEAWAVSLLTQAYFRLLFGRSIPVVRFVGPMLLLLLVCSYDFPMWLPLTAIIAIGLGTLYACLPTRRLIWRMVTLAFMAAGFYYIARPVAKLDLSMAFLSLGCMVAADEIARVIKAVDVKQRFLRGLLGVAAALAICALAAGLGDLFFPAPQQVRLEYSAAVADNSGRIILRLYIFMFVPVCAALTTGLIFLLWSFRRKWELSGNPASMARGIGWRLFCWSCGTIVLLGLSAGLAWCGYIANQSDRWVLRMQYLCAQGMWQEAVDAASLVPRSRFDALLTHDVNMSLSHTGRLGEEMFRFPQTRELLVDMYDIKHEGRLNRVSDMYMELGRFNDAEHTSCEALCLGGPTPDVLRRLAVIHMAKDQPDIARVYLNALSYDMVQGDWARGYLQQIERDRNLSGDEYIQTLRRRRLTDDDSEVLNGIITSVGIYYYADKAIYNVVVRKPPNRVAFEYLMAYELLWGNLDSFVTRLALMKSMGYSHIPRHWQEAALMYMGMTGRQIDTCGLTFDPQVEAKYRKFGAIFQQSKGDFQRALPQLDREDLLDTYFFYYTITLGAMRK